MSLIERSRPLPPLTPIENGYQEEAPDDPIILAAKKCLLESEKVNVSMLRALSAKLLKCKNQEGVVSKLLEQIDFLIKEMNPFPSCLPHEIVVQIAEYVPSEDQIENLVELPFKMVQARVEERTRERIHAIEDCGWIGREAAWAVEKDSRLERDCSLVLSDFSEFFLYAQFHQQEWAVRGWKRYIQDPWKIFNFLPEKMESLFLDFDILETHPQFPQILNRFSNLKILQISKIEAANPLGALNQIDFSNLEELNVIPYYPGLRDQELEHLMDNPSLKKLKKLDIRDLEISKNCIARLQARFPNLEIVT